MTGEPDDSVEVDRVYAGDRMSDLLNQVSETALLVTNLSHAALIRPIELLDVPAICLVNGVEPEPGLVKAAEEAGASILVSPYCMYETCGRLFRVLNASRTAVT
ncbi:MAG: hypothetical protein QG656_620 [Candidatus Hydrogenedentes bacterium]|nr:hypothetical protein [Candidatus Hydrogenedentota bacterium]